ncbi:MAG TPA: hypothetical protein VFM65_09945 [Flavobacteriaceae bacterium]|nr:hypothetical protein [Flavobacteriaceae bacterium]
MKKISDIPAGWVGGFAQSNPKFAYPNPNLTSLPMLDNMANINLLQRQQGVEWPEFSWETEKGKTDPKRCFQMFAPYISRLGYTNTGRIYSIICPQQGIYIKDIGYLNVEVTVTGQRGWVDETNKTLAADMTVEGKIWFGPSAHKSSLGAEFLNLCTLFSGHPFPSKKANAIIVTTHKHGEPEQPIFPVRTGETQLFESPGFAKHSEAWAVGNVEVEIGPIKKRGYALVDEFNKLVMELFNLASGNMLQSGNLLSWNVWFKEPALVDKQEWKDHAEKWRKSIDEDHGSPDGPGTNARYFDGSPFNPVERFIDDKVEEIIAWIRKHL